MPERHLIQIIFHFKSTWAFRPDYVENSAANRMSCFFSFGFAVAGLNGRIRDYGKPCISHAAYVAKVKSARVLIRHVWCVLVILGKGCQAIFSARIFLQ